LYDALLTQGGGHTETIQQKARRRDATPDLLLKHPNTTVATLRLKTDETLEKKTLKTLESHCNHTQHHHKTHTTYV
jgi:hypothetical protein